MCRFFFGFGFSVRFSVRYRVSIEFRFSEYPFHSGKPVLLVILCGMLKLLLGLGQCSVRGQFVGFSGIFGSLVDISGNFMLVGFGGILGLVESSGFFVYGVGIGRILMSVDFGRSSGLVESSGFFVCGVGIRGIFILVGFGGFFRFWFGVVMRGGV